MQPPPLAPPSDPYDRSSSLPSLDNGTNNVDDAVIDGSEQRWAFRLHQPDRLLFLRAIATMELEDTRRLRFEDCGSGAWIYATQDKTQLQVRTSTCNHRLCAICGPRRSSDAAARLNQRLEVDVTDRWKFLTLTLRSSDDGLAVQLDHLRKSFRRLRQTKLWKDKVDYGAAVLEVTYNSTTHRWHPHLHTVMRAAYIAQGVLSEAWEVCSGGSMIVDIREVLSTTAAAGYITKYMGKVPNVVQLPDSLSLFKELWYSIEGAKLQLSFGTFPDHADDDDAEDDPEDKPDFRLWCRLCDVIHNADAGEPEALWIMEVLNNGGLPLRARPPPPPARVIYDGDPPRWHRNPKRLSS